MFEKLIDLIISLWTRLSPAKIIKVFESGAVLRLGKYHRTVLPGLAWKWPVIEDIFEINAVLTTLRLPPQTLTTLDDVGVVVAAIVKYWIVDAEAYVTKIWDQNDVLADTTLGAIAEVVKNSNYHELLRGDPSKKVIEAVRREVNEYGFRIKRITFTDFGKVRSFRLIQQVAKDLDN